MAGFLAQGVRINRVVLLGMTRLQLWSLVLAGSQGSDRNPSEGRGPRRA